MNIQNTNVADDLGRKCEDTAVFVQAEFRIDNFIEAVARREQVLVAIAGPAHRSTEMTGKVRRPECDDAPSILSSANRVWNQTAIASAL
jgi:hypothetical protein